MRLTTHVLGLAAAVGLAGAAEAATVSPSFTPGTPVRAILSLATSDSPVVAIFLYSDADDRSILTTTVGSDPGFINNSPGATSIGTITTFAFTPGPIAFKLENTSTGQTYTTDTLDSDGYGHAVSITGTTNLADVEAALGWRSGTISSQSGMSTAWSTFLGLAGTAPITFIAWEDSNRGEGADWDYNDLVFAFAQVRVAVAEPASLALLGAGLLGFGFAARRRRSA